MEPDNRIRLPDAPDETVLDRPMRVLLVEDDDGDAIIVEDELELSGAPVAVRRVRSLAEARGTGFVGFDCALLDLNLPDTTGLDGLRALREAAPDLAVLVLTGLDDERRGVEAVASGAQDYLVKGATSGAVLHRSIRYAVERRRAELAHQQLSIARLEARENARLERGLLPAPLVSDPTLALATHYRPGRRRALLGGDFYDAVEVPDGRVHAVVGDVSGHGPDEAAVGVALRIAWRALVLAGVPPDEILPHLQEMLVHERHAEGVFTTLCMVTLDPGREGAIVRLAGHPPPVLFDGEEPRTLDAGPPGPPLAVLPAPVWPARHVPLPASWAMLLYTDGLIEGRTPDATRRLGDDGLAALIRAALAAGAREPGELVRHVVERAEELNGGPLVDDVALLLIARRGA
jgi:serine phosphatase RsbU (regulator of sigma subunit)